MSAAVKISVRAIVNPIASDRPRMRRLTPRTINHDPSRPIAVHLQSIQSAFCTSAPLHLCTSAPYATLCHPYAIRCHHIQSISLHLMRLMHLTHLMPLQVGRFSSEHPSHIMRADGFERCCGAPAVVHILIMRVPRLFAMSGRRPLLLLGPPCCEKPFNFQAFHPRIQVKSNKFFARKDPSVCPTS